MSQHKETKDQLVGFLQKGIKYIYSLDDFHENKYWITANTDHMEYIMNQYNNELRRYNYSMMIEVNSLIKYASSNYKSIINYFRENVEEYTNTIYKMICIKYVFYK